MIKIEATVTPEKFPFIEEEVKVVNRKTVNIKGGTVTFYTTALGVIAYKKVIANSLWTGNNGAYDIKFFDLKIPVKIIQIDENKG